MLRRADELRQVAKNCRYLASSCITERARKPLDAIANELEFEADEQERLQNSYAGGKVRRR